MSASEVYSKHRAPTDEGRGTTSGVLLPAGVAATAQAHLTAVHQAIRYMQDRLGESDVKVRTLAVRGRYSRSHFLKVFQDATATTPHHFLACLRMQRAKSLLVHTQLSVTEIALEVGYASFPTFSRTFTTLVGVPPTEYRRSWARLFATLFQGTLTLLRGTRDPSKSAVIGGTIKLPDRCPGVTFVGGFQGSTPIGRPLGGSVIFRSGRFVFPCRSAPKFVLAAFIPFNVVVEKPGHGAPSHVARAPWKTDLEVDLVLRPVVTTDPPVVIALEHLLIT